MTRSNGFLSYKSLLLFGENNNYFFFNYIIKFMRIFCYIFIYATYVEQTLYKKIFRCLRKIN